MDIDLTKCVFGDRLKTRGGEEAIYIGDQGSDNFVHRVAVEGMGSVYTFTNDGRKYEAWESGLDIVEILPREQAALQADRCAVCGELKHTPLRKDKMGGYVCLTCIDRELDRLHSVGELPRETPAPEQKWPKPCCYDSIPFVHLAEVPKWTGWHVRCPMCGKHTTYCPTRDAAVESWDEGRTV